MALSLKDQNKLPLLLILLANVALFILLVQGNSFQLGDWNSVVETLRKALPAGIGLIMVGSQCPRLSS